MVFHSTKTQPLVDRGTAEKLYKVTGTTTGPQLPEQIVPETLKLYVPDASVPSEVNVPLMVSVRTIVGGGGGARFVVMVN